MRQLKKLFGLLVLMVAVVPTGFVAMADTVDNPGGVTITAEANSSIQIGRAPRFVFGGSTPPSTVGGTVDADGNLILPANQTNFQPITIMIGTFSVTVRLVATEDGFGIINPLTGDASAVLTVRVDISGVFIPAGCRIPATTFVLDAGNDGGAAYDATAGTATVVDNSFAVPVSTGCGLLGGIIDGQIGLPSASGNNVVRLNVRLSPILTGS
jgi:hypothetical protein